MTSTAEEQSGQVHGAQEVTPETLREVLSFAARLGTGSNAKERQQPDVRNQVQKFLSDQGQDTGPWLTLSDQIKWLSSIANSGPELGSWQLGFPYPPCIVPLSNLRQMKVEELLVNWHNRGYLLLVRLAADSVQRGGAQVAVVQVETGELLKLMMFNQEHNHDAEGNFTHGSIAVIKEPLYVGMTRSIGTLRVDHLSDIIWLEPTDELVPIDWRASRGSQKTPEEIKKDGNDAVTAENWVKAIRCYTLALKRQDLTHESHALGGEMDVKKNILTKQLRLNRALAKLKVGRYESAIADTDAVLQREPRNEKALFRRCEALYYLQRFSDASASVNLLLEGAAPGSREAALTTRKRIHARLRQQERGVRGLDVLTTKVSLSSPKSDVATYSAPTAIRGSSGRGRGQFATRAINAGEIILCEKALAVSWEHKVGQQKQVFLADNEGPPGLCAEVWTDLVDKCLHNPSWHKALMELHDGGYDRSGLEGTIVDGEPIIDVFLIARIQRLNCFDCDLTLSAKSHSFASLYHDGIDSSQGNSKDIPPTGVWLKASYFNHECQPNSVYSFVGDLMVFRAVRNIAVDEEITSCYIEPLNSTYAQRQSKLKRWGFTCSCPACVAIRDIPPAAVEQEAEILKQYCSTLQEFPEAIALENESLRKACVRALFEKADALLTSAEGAYERSHHKHLSHSLFEPHLNLAAGAATFLLGSEVEEWKAILHHATAALSSIGYKLYVDTKAYHAFEDTTSGSSLRVDSAHADFRPVVIDAFLYAALALSKLGRAAFSRAFVNEATLIYQLLYEKAASMKTVYKLEFALLQGGVAKLVEALSVNPSGVLYQA